MPRISPEKQTDKNTAAVFVAMCLINQRAIFGNTPAQSLFWGSEQISSLSQ